MAVDLLRAAVASAPDAGFLHSPSVQNRRQLLDWLAQTVDTINAALQARSQEDLNLRGMGCTLDVVLVRGRGVFLAHVGDSRVYILRGGSLHRLTEDHNFGQFLLENQVLPPEDVAHHPQRNVLTRALGPFPKVQVDTAYFELAAGDVLLLCSDGLYGELPPERIGKLLALPPQQAVKSLVEAALGEGGRDNITAVVCSAVQSPLPEEAVIGAEATRSLLRSSSLFASFTEGELMRVQKIAQGQRFVPGELLVTQGAACTDLFLVLQGQLSVWRDDHRVGVHEPGDPFGGMALQPLSAADVTVRAESPGYVLVFPLAEIKRLLKSDVTIAAKLSAAALERVSLRLHQMIEAMARYRREVQEPALTFE
jgi:protein phosphatase